MTTLGKNDTDERVNVILDHLSIRVNNILEPVVSGYARISVIVFLPNRLSGIHNTVHDFILDTLDETDGI